MMRKRTLIRGLAVVLLTAVTLFVLQRVLMPKYAVGVVEGALIEEYYQDEKDHDVYLSEVVRFMRTSRRRYCGRNTESTVTYEAAPSS